MTSAFTTIGAFTGRHRWLSNFWWERDGFTAEHRFQAAKTVHPEQHRWVMEAPSPIAAKQRGQMVELRPHWDEVKTLIMLNVVRFKFTDYHLAGLLLNTGFAVIEEGNTWGDDFWGVDLRTGRGENRLGWALMRVRNELRGGM